MEDWVLRALQRWPNVPALYGWLSLDRRGHWRIRGETISRPQIIDTLNRNYTADARGCWYFQNGPQRGYVSLAATPFVLSASADGEMLQTHTGALVQAPQAVYLDEEGSLVIVSEHGAGLLVDTDLHWALSRLDADGPRGGDPEAALADALAAPSGRRTALRLAYRGAGLAVQRLDHAAMPAALGFVREPLPAAGERAVVGDAMS